MPLTEFRRLNTHTLLGRWALTETAAQLQNQPGLPAQLILPATFTHEKRQAEWLASRILAYYLLRQFTPAVYYLENDTNGKPILANCPYHLSISHTQEQVAVILSDKYEVGIDIETIKPKILRVGDRFLAPSEKDHIGSDLAKLTIAWSAKETLYKLYGKKNIIFAENLFLAPFTLAATGTFGAKIRTDSFEKDYTINFEFFNTTILTYCLNDSLPSYTL